MAQTGVVANAADFALTALAGFPMSNLSTAAYIGDYSTPPLIAAGSLAALRYQFTQDGSASIIPTVNIRPVGSAVSFPAQVTPFSSGNIRFVVPANTPPGD